jgi:UDPglucose 6-dehydrogenase
MPKKTTISILGSGIVGSAVGKGLLQLGNEVIFYDLDHRKIEQLCTQGLSATLDLQAAVSLSEISFICVPTPTIRGRLDLSYIKDVTKTLALCLRDKREYHLVVVKSTVLPMTTEKTIIPILETYSKKIVGDRIGVCSNPEFLTEFSGSWTTEKKFRRGFFEEPFIIIGEFDRKSGEKLKKIYDSMGKSVFRMNLRSAEMLKYAINGALACQISYWNEIYYICSKINVNSKLIAQIAGKDQRIGKYGTVHGKAFGGKCLPKDLKALIGYSKQLSYDPKLLKAIQAVNDKVAEEHGVRE